MLLPGELLCELLNRMLDFLDTGKCSALSDRGKAKLACSDVRFGAKADLLPSFVLEWRSFGAPGRIRTCGLWIRNPTLYPAELRVHLRANQPHGLV